MNFIVPFINNLILILATIPLFSDCFILYLFVYLTNTICVWYICQMWKQKAKRMAMLAKNMDNQEETNVQKAQIQTTLRRKYINKKSVTPPSNKSHSEPKHSSMLTEITSSSPGTSTAIETK